jgi:hypothetical protein
MLCFATRQCNSALSDPHHPAAKDSQIRIPEDKSEIGGTYFEHQKQPSTSHDSPRIHHKFTIKKPRFYHPFPPKTPAKRRNLPPPKKSPVQIPISRIAPPNTNGSLLLDRIQIIVEVGGLSNDEVYTNSNRGFGLRVIFRHIRNFDRNRSTLQHELLRENRPAARGPVVPAVCCTGRSQIRLPDHLPGYAHLLPLRRHNQRGQDGVREGSEYMQRRLPKK